MNHPSTASVAASPEAEALIEKLESAIRSALTAARSLAAAPAPVEQSAPPVAEADIDSAREHLADVHNAEQLRSALGQLRREVVIELAARGLVPAIYGAAPAEQPATTGADSRNPGAATTGAAEQPAGEYPTLPESLVRSVDRWFAQNTGLGGCSDKDVAELAAIFYDVPFDGGRESAEDALAVVNSFGPGIQGLNDTFARQIILAAEVKLLRAALASQGQEALHAAPDGTKFFAHDPECGTDFYKTADEARKAAEESIAEYRHHAHHDGEWNEEVEQVCWGVAIEQAASFEIGDEDEVNEDGERAVDFKLAPLGRCQHPAPAADSAARTLVGLTEQERIAVWGEAHGTRHGYGPLLEAAVRKFAAKNGLQLKEPHHGE